MYSQKEKKKAVDLYIKYDKQLSKTVETLGYPSHNSLRKWYYEFRDSGEVKITYTRKQKYTEEQKDKAIRHYFEHGTNVTNTIAALGYPCRPILKAWIDDKFPNQKKDCSYQKQLVEYTELIKNITEFHIPAGKIYLSPIIDCFDGTVVSWTIGTAPNADLVNTMLDNAIVTLKSGVHPIIHSDRGAHYRWPGWIKRMNDAKLIRSMSRKGCSPDNSACEGFFGRLKNEMFYSNSWLDVTIDSFIIYKG